MRLRERERVATEKKKVYNKKKKKEKRRRWGKKCKLEELSATGIGTGTGREGFENEMRERKMELIRRLKKGKW